jgi:ATP-dependent DNA helicase RecQ
MPPNMPVLGTTATANNRVIQDVQTQLGDIEIQRGPLVRDSLSLQTLRLPDQASRLAWLAQHIPELPGTGIVYVLTIRDAEQVATWLNQQGIVARAYNAAIWTGCSKYPERPPTHLCCWWTT